MLEDFATMRLCGRRKCLIIVIAQLSATYLSEGKIVLGEKGGNKIL